MPEGYDAGGDFSWPSIIAAVVTVGVAIVIGTLWERWRRTQ